MAIIPGTYYNNSRESISSVFQPDKILRAFINPYLPFEEPLIDASDSHEQKTGKISFKEKRSSKIRLFFRF